MSTVLLLLLVVAPLARPLSVAPPPYRRVVTHSDASTPAGGVPLWTPAPGALTLDAAAPLACSRDLALADDTRRVRYYWTRRLWLCDAASGGTQEMALRI